MPTKQRLLMLLGLFVLFALPTTIASGSNFSSIGQGCLDDGFSTPTLSPDWTWIDPLGDSSYSLTANSGYLRIQTPDGNHDMAGFNTNAPRIVRPISGDFQIQTKVTINPVQTYQAAGLLIWFDNSNLLWIGRSTGNKLGHHFLRAGNYYDPPEVTGITNNTVYLRVVRNANTFSTYYSLNGISWTMTGSIEYPAASSTAQAGLFLINNWQDNPISADFDYFQINCNSSTHSVFLPLVVRQPSPALMEKIVFTIAYMDATPLNDPDAHQQEFITGLRRASIWHGYDRPNEQSALGYNTSGGSVIRLYEAPPHRTDNDQFDYAAVYARFDLCSKIQAGLVDEVWIWESGTGHAWEWVTNGPNWSWTWGSNVPNCGRTVTTMNLNYQREIDVAYESFNHRLEGAFMTHYPCDFYTQTWPWTGSPSWCVGLVSDRFGFVARPFAGNNQVAVCGDAHHPPNITDNREYVYDDHTYAQSICKDWQWDGSGLVSTFNCEEWGCTHQGYHIWWMQNLPGYGNHNHNRNGNVMPNWWEALFQ
jgi:regulation of enolase protein 1 (concanavalin A-like superfamily)